MKPDKIDYIDNLYKLCFLTMILYLVKMLPIIIKNHFFGSYSYFYKDLLCISKICIFQLLLVF